MAGPARIRLGCEPVCEVCFDAERDEVVSRVHCHIDVGVPEGPAYMLTDLNSRNGTFVNRRRITAPVEMRSGDIVQLGRGGPEMKFKICD